MISIRSALMKARLTGNSSLPKLGHRKPMAQPKKRPNSICTGNDRPSTFPLGEAPAACPPSEFMPTPVTSSGRRLDPSSCQLCLEPLSCQIDDEVDVGAVVV